MALRAALLLCALAAAPSRALDGEDVTVSAVLLLSRHADRELLVKSGAGFAEATSGLLTEVGYARMQALGHTLRQRYAGDLRLPAAGDADASRLAHTRVEARSSGFDRSIASGDAVLQQLLEGMPRRPIVFSQQDDNDILLRGYSKCAAFHATVAQERKSSQRYINRDDGTREMRLKAARALGQPDAAAAALHGVWNLYDLAERAPKAIQDEFLEPLSELRDWVAEFEYEDSRHDATASYLLRDANSFLRSFQAWEAKTGDKPGHVTYKHYFAHFPTLVCTLRTSLHSTPLHSPPLHTHTHTHTFHNSRPLPTLQALSGSACPATAKPSPSSCSAGRRMRPPPPSASASSP